MYLQYLSHQFFEEFHWKDMWVAASASGRTVEWLRASRFGEDHHLQSTAGINGLLKTLQVRRERDERGLTERFGGVYIL